ncbi:hypothetical protein ACIBEJ_29460 [Nonomuraea sp. NPDC050790]|uniref:hypothetical protein n=1 Tax=Nonomuraea sp. NPDC050790 TaxID=3364371 RepID=UPI00379AC9A5
MGRTLVAWDPGGVNEPISQALVVYLSAGASWPRKDPAALAKALGPEQAAKLLPTLDALADEMLDIPVNWTDHTLRSGTAEAVAEMRVRHPGLTGEALRQLGRYFSYTWK